MLTKQNKKIRIEYYRSEADIKVAVLDSPSLLGVIRSVFIGR
jgi:hypothetical protein